MMFVLRRNYFIFIGFLKRGGGGGGAGREGPPLDPPLNHHNV